MNTSIEFPVAGDSTPWEIKLDGLAFGIHEIGLNDTRAEFDSMSVFIWLSASVDAFL